MPLRIIPGRIAIVGLAASSVAALAALLMGLAVTVAAWAAATAIVALLVATIWDYARSQRAWRQSSATMTRRLPTAFALGGKRPVPLAIETKGTAAWHCELYDHHDSSLLVEGLPLQLTLLGDQRTNFGLRPCVVSRVKEDAASTLGTRIT